MESDAKTASQNDLLVKIDKLDRELSAERVKRFAAEQRLAATQQEENKLRFFETAVRFVADVPKGASPFAASTQVARVLHTWSAFRARVAGMLGCAPDSDPDAMLSALGQRFKPRDEVSEVLALKGEITTLKGQLSAAEARGRVLQNELTEAQKQCAAWEVQAQDHRDRATAFLNQVSRALGAEPSSLSTDEALRRINEGAAAWRAYAGLVEALRINRPVSAVTPDELIEWAKQTYQQRALADRLTASLRRSAAFDGIEHLCNLLENGRIAEIIRCSDAWFDLVRTYNAEAAHSTAPVISVDVAGSKETLLRCIQLSTLAERLTTAVRAQLPQFVGTFNEDPMGPLFELCHAIERKYIAQALWTHSAWGALVEQYNARRGKARELTFESAATKEAFKAAIDRSARLREWLAAQSEQEG